MTRHERVTFSPKELGNRWGVSEQQIRTMCARGELPYFKVGKLIRIRFDVVSEHEKDDQALK